VIEHFVQRRDAAVVHVRCGDGDIAKRRCLEPSDVSGGSRGFVEARAARRITQRAGDVVETDIVKLRAAAFAPSFEVDLARKREPSVAAEAGERLAHIQRLASTRGRRNRPKR
jgi:hypothetical protein